MRDYFEIKALWVHYTLNFGDGDLIAFGGDEKQLNKRMRLLMNEVRTNDPSAIFHARPVRKIYFKLNEENFADLLNGPRGGVLGDSGFAYFIWNNSPLNPFLSTPVASGGNYFYSMTQLDSPRKTWSGGK